MCNGNMHTENLSVMGKKLSTAVVIIIMMAMMLAATLSAQNINGGIVGTVTDQSGAVVPNAKVIITNTDTNVVVRTLNSDESGHYSAPQLPIGHYKVRVEATNFGPVEIKDIELNVNSTLTEDARVAVGSTETTVTVEADAQQVQLQNASASTLISGTQIRELSLNNRNYEQLVNLAPGVSYGGGDQLYIGTTNPSGQTNVVSFSLNGQRNSANNWTVDGADNVDRGSNLTLLNYPSVDAIAEFKILRGLYSPEFGRAAAGQINVVTKSGADQFHGNAYEFFRNDVLNANNYFNKPNAFNPTANVKRPALRYNNFGYTIGGPIYRGKTFFFFSQEFRRVITYAAVTPFVATAAQRAGTFVNPVCLDIRPAGSTAACTTTGTQVTAINPVAAAYISAIFGKMPLPTSGNLVTVPLRNVFNHRQELVRIDHTFNQKLSMFGRYINDTIPTEEPGGLFTGSTLPGVSTTKTNSPGRGILVSAAYTHSPTVLADFGYGFSYGAILSDPIGLVSKSVSTISNVLPFVSTLNRVPGISVAGGASAITGFGQYRDYNRNHNLFGNLTAIKGRHTTRWGVTYHRYQKTENNGGPNAGSFAFANTGKPAGATSDFEQAWANFLLGNVGTYSQASLDLTPDIRTSQWEGYGQDEWRIKDNLTLTYGLRYSLFREPVDAKRELTNFDPETFVLANAPAIGTTGLIVAGAGDPLNGIIINDNNSPYKHRVSTQPVSDIAPRLGIAWDPFHTGKTSVRAGYGMFFDASLFGIYEQNIFTNPPFVNSITISNTRLENAAAASPNVNLVPKTLRGSPLHAKNPNTQQWSLDVQQELPGGFIADVGFYGSKSTHLLGIIDINQPIPGEYITAGLTTGAFITSSTTQLLNRIRPYKGYGAINVIMPLFNANYNSLQTSVQKRFKGKSQIAANYTWSHALTDAQSDRSSAAQNSRDIRAEYGPAALDRRHIFKMSAVYELPWMREQQGFIGHVLGGWQTSGVMSAVSGTPLTIFSTVNVDPAGLGCKGSSACSTRPDMVASPSGPKTILQWFNTDAFADVPAGQYRPGNAGRGVVSGPGAWRTDVSLFKNIKISERVNAQFRTETFNVFNHTNLSGVGVNKGTPSTYNKVTSAGDPRNIQFGLKIGF